MAFASCLLSFFQPWTFLDERTSISQNCWVSISKCLGYGAECCFVAPFPASSRLARSREESCFVTECIFSYFPWVHQSLYVPSWNEQRCLPSKEDFWCLADPCSSVEYVVFEALLQYLLVHATQKQVSYPPRPLKVLLYSIQENHYLDQLVTSGLDTVSSKFIHNWSTSIILWSCFLSSVASRLFC